MTERAIDFVAYAFYQIVHRFADVLALDQVKNNTKQRQQLYDNNNNNSNNNNNKLLTYAQNPI